MLVSHLQDFPPFPRSRIYSKPFLLTSTLQQPLFGRVWRFEKFLAFFWSISYISWFFVVLSYIYSQIYETSLYCQTKDVVFIVSPFRFVYLTLVSVESHREFTHFWRRPKMINCRVTFTLLFFLFVLHSTYAICWFWRHIWHLYIWRHTVT